MVLLETVAGKWKGRRYKLHHYVMVINKMINKTFNVEDLRNRMFLFANLSNVFLQEQFRVTVVETLRQLYHPLILGT